MVRWPEGFPPPPGPGRLRADAGACIAAGGGRSPGALLGWQTSPWGPPRAAHMGSPSVRAPATPPDLAPPAPLPREPRPALHDPAPPSWRRCEVPADSPHHAGPPPTAGQRLVLPQFTTLSGIVLGVPWSSASTQLFPEGKVTRRSSARQVSASYHHCVPLCAPLPSYLRRSASTAADNSLTSTSLRPIDSRGAGSLPGKNMSRLAHYP